MNYILSYRTEYKEQSKSLVESGGIHGSTLTVNNLYKRWHKSQMTPHYKVVCIYIHLYCIAIVILHDINSFLLFVVALMEAL